MEAPTSLICALLSCGYLDVAYLIKLLEAYDLDVSDLMDDLSEYFGDSRPKINDLIFVALDRVAQEFLSREVKSRRRRFTSDEYSIYTNCMDSHLWFEDADLNRWFEIWRKY